MASVPVDDLDFDMLELEDGELDELMFGFGDVEEELNTLLYGEDDSDENVNVIMPERSRNPAPPTPAKEWTNLSKTWIAEESGRGCRGPEGPKLNPNEADVSSASTSSAVPDRRPIIYYEDGLGERNGPRVQERLDFKNRKSAAEMIEVVRSEVDDYDDYDEDEEEEEEEEVESENVEWTKRLLGPRMRMYADDEVGQRKRVANINRLHNSNQVKAKAKRKNLVVTVSTGDEEEDGHRHRREWQRERKQYIKCPRFYLSPSPTPVRRPPRRHVHEEDMDRRRPSGTSTRRARTRRHSSSSSPERERRRHSRHQKHNRDRSRSRSPIRVRRHSRHSRTRSRRRAHAHTRDSSSSPDMRPVSRRLDLSDRFGRRLRRSRQKSSKVDYERDGICERYLDSQNIGRVHRGPINYGGDMRRRSVKDRLG